MVEAARSSRHAIRCEPLLVVGLAAPPDLAQRAVKEKSTVKDDLRIACLQPAMSVYSVEHQRGAPCLR